VPLGMCVVVPVMLAGSMDMVTIAEKQAGWFWNWYLFHDPFTFIVFWVYVTCAVASVNRAPFDLAEAESELVAGFHTEYSGLRWSYFFMAEYGSMFLVSAMAAVLFLGGWNGPIPVATLLGLSEGTGDTAPYAVRLLGLVNLVGKASLGVIIMMWIRWTHVCRGDALEDRVAGRSPAGGRPPRSRDPRGLARRAGGRSGRRAGGRPCHLAGGSLRPSWPSLTSCWCRSAGS